jgi:hypothetical protein
MTILKNTIVHERVRSTIEAYRADRPFDLITMRMVTEHITDLAAAVTLLARLTVPVRSPRGPVARRWAQAPISPGPAHEAAP